MAFGLDIYRYQTVTDWNAVKNAGVKFILVKLTDGNGPAIARGDSQVSGAIRVGIPVGGYHFAQKGSPVRQADVFKMELDRLARAHGAMTVMPALDIESVTGIVTWTGNEMHAFAVDFCRRMREWYPRVLLYANTSELKAMRAAEIIQKVPGVFIWEANYSSNNGVRHALPANSWAPWRAAHQYTSKGSVPGIKASGVDLNDGELSILIGTGDDVSAEDVMRWKVPVRVDEGQPPAQPVEFESMITHTNYASWKAANNSAEAVVLLRELSGNLTETESRLLAAYSSRPTNIDMDDADVARSLEGMTSATQAAFVRIGQLLQAGAEQPSSVDGSTEEENNQ